MIQTDKSSLVLEIFLDPGLKVLGKIRDIFDYRDDSMFQYLGITVNYGHES